MQYILKFLPWIILLAVIVFAAVIGIGYLNHLDQIEQQGTYQRQLEGDLTAKEKQLQELNSKLGVSASDLMTQKELNSKLADDNEELNDNFEEFKKEHKLQILSRDKTIAALKQKVSGGHTEVVVSSSCEDISSCTISYMWHDPLNRFQLKDPDIFKKDNETFVSNQSFKIYGEIYKQEDGFLQTRRLVLREVYKDGDEYKPVPNGKAEVVDSEFQYVSGAVQEEWEWTDLFTLRPIIGSSVVLFPYTGDLRLNIGMEFIGYKGFGLNSYTSLFFDDPMKISQHIGLSWSSTVFDKRLNFALVAGVGYSLNQEVLVDAGIIFYIW